MNADQVLLQKHVEHYNRALSSENRTARTSLFVPNNRGRCVYSLSQMERATLHSDVARASALLKPYKRLHSIPWKFVFVRVACDIENNFPHTHAHTILLPSIYFSMTTPSRVKLLIHEKTHVFQRYYPIPYNKIVLQHLGYAVHSYLPAHPDFARVRANPDTNGIVYSRDRTYVLPILDERATRLSDVRVVRYSAGTERPAPNKGPGYKAEHPNEALAYYLEERVPERTVAPEIAAWL